MKTKITIEAMRELMNGNMNGAREIMNNTKEFYDRLDTIINKITNKVVEEYDLFKEEMLKQPNSFIFNESYRISSYTDLLFYFKNDGFSLCIESFFENHENNKEKYFKMLYEFSEKNILNTIYEDHFNYEELYFTTWEQIEQLMTLIIFDTDL